MTETNRMIAQFGMIEGDKSELARLKNRLERLERDPTGGSGGGGLEARIAKLEAHVEHMGKSLDDTRADTRDIRDRTIRLEEKVAHLPSKGFIVSVVLTSLAVIAAFAVG